MVAAAVVPLSADDEITDAQGRSEVCTVYERPDGFARGGGLPGTAFSGPTAAVPTGAFGDAIEAGWVVIRYDPGLPEAYVSELRDWLSEPATDRVVAGADPTVEAVTASSADRTQVCTGYDIDALLHFTADRLSE